mmetsp:Transcript_61501/g.173715  ORF Transcript_61501/g.173715 Transcript_61501/m.173715 type:complete len:253 (-) Transcript_61501:251-1009(-)
MLLLLRLLLLGLLLLLLHALLRLRLLLLGALLLPLVFLHIPPVDVLRPLGTLLQGTTLFLQLADLLACLFPRLAYCLLELLLRLVEDSLMHLLCLACLLFGARGQGFAVAVRLLPLCHLAQGLARLCGLLRRRLGLLGGLLNGLHLLLDRGAVLLTLLVEGLLDLFAALVLQALELLGVLLDILGESLGGALHCFFLGLVLVIVDVLGGRGAGGGKQLRRRGTLLAVSAGLLSRRLRGGGLHLPLQCFRLLH